MSGRGDLCAAGDGYATSCELSGSDFAAPLRAFGAGGNIVYTVFMRRSIALNSTEMFRVVSGISSGMSENPYTFPK